MFGWAGLCLDLFPVDLDFSPHHVSFLFGHILPMLVALSWGGRYAFLAAVPGLGGEFAWFVWPENGAANLVWAVVLPSWFVWHGVMATRRLRSGATDRVNLYAAEAIFAVFRTFVAVYLAPPASTFNPVPWAPDALPDLPDLVAQSIAVKEIINGFLIVFLCDLLLTQPTLRKLLGLRPDEHEAAYRPVLSGSLLLGFLIILVDSGLDYYFSNPEGLSFTFFVLPSDDGEKVVDQALFLIACMMVGLIAAEQLSRRRAAETLASQSEKRFRLLVEESPAPMLAVDGNDVIQFANHAFAQVFGTGASELMSIPRLNQLFTPKVSGGGAFLDRWKAIRADGSGVIEVEIATPSGTRWVEWAVRRIDDRTLVMLHDLTARREMEESLKLTAIGVSSRTGPGFFQALAGHLATALGADSAAISVLEEGEPPRARILGWVLDGQLKECSVYPLAGTPCGGLMEGRPCVVPRGVRGLYPGAPEAAALDAEAYIGVPIRDSAGRVIGLISAIYRHPVDDTALPVSILQVFAMRTAAEIERMESESRFRHGQKMEVVGRMAGSITHDFNNMLTPITGYSDLLLRDPALAPAHQEMVQQILAASRRARDLTRRLLAFSRRQVMDMKPCDLGKVISGFQPLLRQVLGDRVALTLRQTGTACTVMCDPGQIEHALMNLAVNASDAMPEGGELTLSVTVHEVLPHYAETHAGVPVGRVAMVSVRDTGVGMSEEVKSHLFEPFFTTKERGRRTGPPGLGVRHRAAARRGLVVESAPGRGTEFRIYLPLCESDREESPGPDLLADPGVRGSEPVVLVEDDEQARDLMTRQLTELGYSVRVFPGPEECLAYFATDAAAERLLITDVVMPGGNGRDLVEKLHQTHPALRVLYVSGYAEDVLQDGRNLPAGSCFLQKPFSMQVFAARVREALSTQT
ncbi:MAG: response regulator [Kiritimatiellia bacterium]